MHKYEFTQAEYIDLMENNPSFGCNADSGELAADLPVDSVTWEEAREYCRRFNEHELKAGRLPEGQLAPNPWGLYDIHGNVFEWCLDVYDAYEEGGFVAFSGADYKLIRGGSFYCPATILRSACPIEPQIADFRNRLTGLRVFLAPKR